jgi:hypothetical protein
MNKRIHKSPFEKVDYIISNMLSTDEKDGYLISTCKKNKNLKSYFQEQIYNVFNPFNQNFILGSEKELSIEDFLYNIYYNHDYNEINHESDYEQRINDLSSICKTKKQEYIDKKFDESNLYEKQIWNLINDKFDDLFHYYLITINSNDSDANNYTEHYDEIDKKIKDIYEKDFILSLYSEINENKASNEKELKDIIDRYEKFMNSYWVINDNEEKNKNFAYTDYFFSNSYDYPGNAKINILIAASFFPIYTNLILSVLKCEYLFNDSFSRDNVKKVQDYIDTYLSKKFNTTYGYDQDIDNEFSSCLRSVESVCGFYIDMNRQISSLISVERIKRCEKFSFNKSILQSNFENFLRENGNNKILAAHNLSPFFYITLPFIFDCICRVTLLDHNFVVSNDNIIGLLDSINSCRKIRELEIVSSSKENKLLEIVFDKEFNEFKDAIFLFEQKASFLLYKIIYTDRNDKKLLSKYHFRIGNKIISFSDNNYRINDGNNLIEYQSEKTYRIKSEVVDLFISFFNKDENSKILLPHEKDIIKNINFKLNKNNYDELDRIILSLKNDIDTINNTSGELDENSVFNDITTYNENASNIIEQNFIEFTKKIKEIDQSKCDKTDGLQIFELRNLIMRLDDIDKFIQTRKQKNQVLSLSFLSKYLIYYTKVVDSLSKNSNSFSNDIYNLIFKVINVIDSLISELKNLYEYVDSGFYSSCYASFFQDCFFRISEDNNERLQNTLSLIDLRDNNVYSDQHIVFIASTWKKPIFKDKFKRTVNEYSAMVKSSKNSCYNNYFIANQNILDKKLNIYKQQTDDSLKKSNEETKRSTIQILGILGGFMSLAAVSIGGKCAFNSTPSFVAFICSMTLCFMVFAILLHFIPSQEYNSKETYNNIQNENICEILKNEKNHTVKRKDRQSKWIIFLLIIILILVSMICISFSYQTKIKTCIDNTPTIVNTGIINKK